MANTLWEQLLQRVTGVALLQPAITALVKQAAGVCTVLRSACSNRISLVRARRSGKWVHAEVAAWGLSIPW